MLKQDKKRIAIVGYKSFIQSHLNNFLNKKYHVKKIKFKDLNDKKLKNIDIIINCSNSKDFYEKQYSKKSDRNIKIASAIKNSKTKLFFLSTRQTYHPKLNLTEKSKLNPINTYAKNCIKSEKNCKKLLENKLLILRLSNVIGYEINKKKKASLMSIIIKGLKKNKIYFDNNYYLKKDFLPINLLCKYIEALVQKDINGVFNVGSGIPVRVNEFIKTIIDVRKVNIVIKLKKNFKDKDFCFKLNKIKKLTGIKIDKKKLTRYFSELKRKIN